MIKTHIAIPAAVPAPAAPRSPRRATSLGAGVGLAIRCLREYQGMTQAQLASAANLSQGTVSLVEGGRSDASLDSLQRIAAALGEKRLSRIVQLAEDMQDPKKVLRDAERLVRKYAKPGE